MSDDLTRRTTFDAVAERYRAHRPHYPEKLFDALVEAADLTPESQLLEIGPGPGHATEPLARRGYAITAIELGPNLAKVARETLAPYPNVRVLIGAFETAELPAATYDLIYAASAFHWIEPAVKFSKPHALLKPGGHLAIMRARPVSDEAGDDFFFASRPIYDRYRAGSRFDNVPRPDRAGDLTPNEVDDALFTVSYFGTFPTALDYTAADYAALLATYSPTLALPPEEQAGFLDAIESLVDEKFGGSITRHYAMSLTVARRLSAA